MANKDINTLYPVIGLLQSVSILLIAICGFIVRGIIKDVHELRKDGCDISRQHIEWHKGRGDIK